MIIILISKGRNLLKTLIYLKYFNIYILDNLIISRKLVYETNYRFLKLIIIKNLDISFYINNNIIDFVFFGKDLLLENNINIYYKFYNLYFLKFYLSLIGKNILFINFNKKIIATKYINISKNYFYFLNIKNIKFLKINSSCELMLVLKKSNLIIDIISSGKTIKENNLYNIFNILRLNNILLLNINILYIKIFMFFLKKYIFNIFNVIF